MDLTITTSSHDGVTVITTTGDVDIYTCGDLRPAVREAARTGPLVIDLDQCEFLDSSGLGVLVGAMKEAKAAGHGVAFACTREPLLKVFRVTGLEKIMRICDTAAEAVQAVQDDG